MASNFFQPGDASGTRTDTPSPASQAMMKFRADLFGRLLEAAGNTRSPTFKQFTKGATVPRGLPSGLNAGIGDLLMAMNQPGAFTSTSTQTGHGVTPSMFSDLASLGLLGAQLYNSGILGDALSGGKSALDWILSGTGGAAGIGGVNPALGDLSPDEQAIAQDTALASYFYNADPAQGNSYGVLASDADDNSYLMSLLGLL